MTAPIPATEFSRRLESALQTCFTRLNGLAVDDDILAGTLLNNMAVACQELGRFDESDAFYKSSLARWERRLPGNHTWIAQSLSNRASLYREMEVYPEAERVFQLALGIWRHTGWPSATNALRRSDSLDVTESPLWSEEPKFASGHVLPRYGAAIQTLKAGVQAGGPAATGTVQQAIEKLAPWYHNVDLGFGLFTQPSIGDYPASRWTLIKDFAPLDLSGKTVLDIGCNSGFFSFKMKERNAARVVGIDIMPHILAQARFLAHWFNYPVELYQLGAYDVEQLQTRFDSVVFVGVLYHLKHPLYALEKVSNVCNETMYFQTVVRGAVGDFEPKENYPITEVSIFEDANYPRMYFVEKSFNGDESNWWFATRSCVKAMLRVAGFTRITDTQNNEVLICHKEPGGQKLPKMSGSDAALQDSALDKVKNMWGADSSWAKARMVHWMEHPKVQERLNFLASGDPAKNRFEYFMEKYCAGLMPFKRVITLGCGHGELERGLARYNFALTHDAVDITDAAIHKASELAGKDGLTHIHYKTADLNNIQLQPHTYDVVFGISSVHHVANLEHLFEQVSLALKPGGYFFLDEFVGPSQFQWTGEQLKVINEAIAAMPAQYKKCVDPAKGSKMPVMRPTIEGMNQIDPSEAIRSAEILPLLSRAFEVIEVRGCGGTVLHLLLDDITGNFTEGNVESMRYLQSLFDLEDSLIQSGKLPHDFAVIIARNKN